MANGKGEVATIVEERRSQAEGPRDPVASLKRCGDDAERLFSAETGIIADHPQQHGPTHRRRGRDPYR